MQRKQYLFLKTNSINITYRNSVQADSTNINIVLYIYLVDVWSKYMHFSESKYMLEINNDYLLTVQIQHKLTVLQKVTDKPPITV